MRSGDQCPNYDFNMPQCCFVSFFSPPRNVQSYQQGNMNIFSVSDESNHLSSFRNQPFLTTNQQKASLLNIKRSISSLKQKNLMRNRSTLDTQQPIPDLNLQFSGKKNKNSLQSSQAIRRYYSPNSINSNTFENYFVQNPKNVDDNSFQRNQPNKTNFQQQQSNKYLKKQPVNESIKFPKHIQRNPKQINLNPTVEVAHIHPNYSYQNKIQNNHKTWQKINIQSTATNFPNSSRSKNSSKNSQTPIIATFRNPLSRRETAQQATKQVQKVTILKQQNLNKNKLFRKSSLQKILEQKKQEFQESGNHQQAPQNPFKHIESFVQIIKLNRQKMNYEGIKTKGRPVESMVDLSKDLTKTKKMSKENRRKRQQGLNEMQNVTVTSQYDDQQVRDRVQKIEESAVLLNFFNPPKDLKERLQLSKHNKPTVGRSGLY